MKKLFQANLVSLDSVCICHKPDRFLAGFRHENHLLIFKIIINFIVTEIKMMIERCNILNCTSSIYYNITTLFTSSRCEHFYINFSFKVFFYSVWDVVSPFMFYVIGHCISIMHNVSHYAM